MGTSENTLAEINEFIKANSHKGSTSIMVSVDVSGSMSRPELDFTRDAIDVITADLNTNVRIFSMEDTGMQREVKELKSFSELNISYSGASDANLAFRYIANKPVHIGIIITDGMVAWPEKSWLSDARNSQGQPVTWLIIGTAKDNGQYKPVREAGAKVITANIN